MPELVCYRAAAYRTPVRTRAHARPGGRYHRAGSPPTQYLSLHPLAPWAEVLRNAGVRDVAEALEVRPPVWALRLVLDEPPFELGFEEAAGGALGGAIAPEELVDDDQAACRALGDLIRADPSLPRVLRVPSAALPGADNLVVFGARVRVEYLRAPRRATQVPAALVAAGGHAPARLVPLVRHRGEAHAGLEAWRAGRAVEVPALEPGGG